MRVGNYLLAADDGLVVIANSNLWFRESADAALGAVGVPVSRDPAGRLESLSASLLGAVRSLQDAGHTVLIVQAVPHWGDSKDSFGWQSCSLARLMAGQCATTMPLADALSRGDAAADVTAAVAGATGVSLLDLSAEICPGGVCSSVSADGLIRYRDGTHITVEQSEALAETFEAAIAAAG